ncbi:LOW QUALITY PROTEIN: hypothetical protein V2J09_006394 [Rumex salicifolius]
MALLNCLKSLRFPDGYVSNIGRCMQLQEGKKSHDCHVFMQRQGASPYGYMGSICSSTLDKQRIDDLIHDAPHTLCQLERISPPSFFDSMEHLIVHLPYLRGPVQYRWMYLFERFLFILKGNMLNP